MGYDGMVIELSVITDDIHRDYNGVKSMDDWRRKTKSAHSKTKDASATDVERTEVGRTTSRYSSSGNR